MAIPEVIPIGYESDHHSDTISHWDGGQFLAVTEVFEGDRHAELHPEGIGFYEPWDGSYDT
ncbi:hypothetical protein GCM10010466_36270 [Planomonospora alba]|uniref:Uncharacterized protein n=1 Tax=Planomonospora alba TaxID=161354 RepID=A0ABP6NAQ9_9ACTN